MESHLNPETIEKAYALAKPAYAAFGIDTDKTISAAMDIPISVHCWQGDDVTGFEGADGLSGGGILTTGNYPGRARNGDELRADAEFAFTLIPGTKRFNLHTFYAEPAGKRYQGMSLNLNTFKNGWTGQRKIKFPWILTRAFSRIPWPIPALPFQAPTRRSGISG